MLVPRFYEDLNVMHDKTMPARTYYIPASVRMNDLVEHRERSDRFQLLNGEWKFQYYNSIYDVTESFYEKGYDVSGFDQVTVPGVWQMDGYDTHQYTNIRYRFHSIHHMCHRIFHVEHMFITLNITEKKRHQKHF